MPYGNRRANRTADANHTLAFDPNLVPVRQSLFDMFEATYEWSRASQVHTSIPPDTLATLPDNGFNINIRIAHIFIAATLVEPAELRIKLNTSQLSL